MQQYNAFSEEAPVARSCGWIADHDRQTDVAAEGGCPAFQWSLGCRL
jgi:hypothetical protein